VAAAAAAAAAEVGVSGRLLLVLAAPPDAEHVKPRFAASFFHARWMRLTAPTIACSSCNKTRMVH
jgi:hypothetical protein